MVMTAWGQLCRLGAKRYCVSEWVDGWVFVMKRRSESDCRVVSIVWPEVPVPQAWDIGSISGVGGERTSRPDVDHHEGQRVPEEEDRRERCYHEHQRRSEPADTTRTTQRG
eukprot:1405297-Rhodomonas_salina.1